MEFTPLVPVSEWVHLGDIVTIPAQEDSHTLYRVVKVNPKKYVLEDQAGKQYTIQHRGVKKAPAGTVFDDAPKAPVPELVLGEVVEFVDSRSRVKFPGMYVVIGLMGEDRAKYATLGGAGNRYVTGSRRSVRKLERGEILARI